MTSTGTGGGTSIVARVLLASVIFHALLATATANPAHSRTPSLCTGDCNDDARVTIYELITLVNIAFGTAPISACPSAADSCGEEICVQIAIDFIMSAVNNALYGCPNQAPICGGFAGVQCAPRDVCDLHDPTCAIADLDGVCVRRPRYCPLVIRPVCACDGQTYRNDCVRLRAGVTLAHDGPCDAARCCAPGQFCIPELPPCP